MKMDFIDIVTFIINNKQYCLHYNYVKGLPIFEELKKSDKVETVEYMDNIDQEEINIVFRIIYGSQIDYKKLSITSTFKIYYFMMFLAIEKDIIDIFVKESFKKFKFSDIVDYGIETKQDIQFFDTFPFYTNSMTFQIFDDLMNMKNDYIKIALVDRFISRVLEKEYANKLTICNSYSHNEITKLYVTLFGFDRSYIYNIVKIVWTNTYGTYGYLVINDKAIPNVNVTIKHQTDWNGYSVIEYDVYDTIKSHIRQLLLGQVVL